ncbi:FG-GAP-like repeat-containing protein [Rubrivirga sp. IMCC45206]|uniref:FG-GAP-like repeat-containing protein n=1 Tax=Rubrivirga sp. IMCC45206 TaxID=3391614 RepID=UPI00398FB7AA
MSPVRGRRLWHGASPLLALTASTLVAFAVAPAAQVRAHQTISAVEGGFAGPLGDGDRFGVSAAPLGDLDGDGRPEVAVGASGDRGGRGAVWILSLRPDGTVHTAVPIRLDTEPGDLFGTSVAALGDLDGDGTVEVAVGADHADDGGPDRGAVHIVSLQPDASVVRVQTISATDGGLVDAPADGDLFGHSVAAIGDLDGDGRPELAVGADDADDGGPQRGAVWILFLNADATVRRSQRISDTAGGFTGTLGDGDLFGQAVAGVGDLDGDGTPDLAVAATRDDDGGADRGAVWILFLNVDGTTRAHQKISATAGGFGGALAEGDVFGSSLVATGDLDGDGTPDLAVGAARDDDGGPERGAAWLLFLTTDGTVRAHQKLSDTVGGDTGAFADGDEWTPAALLGDLDGDGAADLLLGARLADIGGPTRGAARVLFTGYPVATAPRPLAIDLTVGPSPTRGPATVRFTLASPGRVSVDVVDMLGRTWHTTASNLPSGPHRLAVDARRWPGGLYVVRLSAAGARATRALVVVR